MKIHVFSDWRKTKNQCRAPKPTIGVFFDFVHIIRYLSENNNGNTAGNSQILGWDIL